MRIDEEKIIKYKEFLNENELDSLPENKAREGLEYINLIAGNNSYYLTTVNVEEDHNLIMFYQEFLTEFYMYQKFGGQHNREFAKEKLFNLLVLLKKIP